MATYDDIIDECSKVLHEDFCNLLAESLTREEICLRICEEANRPCVDFVKIAALALIGEVQGE